MQITISGSTEFAIEMKKIADQLTKLGHLVFLPNTAARIINNELTADQIKKEKESGSINERIVNDDLIKCHYDKIINSDAVLITNFNKKGIDNYIGPSAFMEIGFAHVNDKLIFLLNPIPKGLIYSDDIETMNPIVLNGDLNLIHNYS